MEQTQGKIHEELCRIQAELKAPKNLRGHGYMHRSAETILEAFKKVRGTSRLNLSDRVEPVGDRIYVVATATLIAEDGSTEQSEAWAREPVKLANMSEPQVSGAASSYARKYALNGLFAIDDNQDADDASGKETDDPPTPVTTETLDALQALAESVCEKQGDWTPERVTAGIKAASKNRVTEAANLTEPEAKWLIGQLDKAKGGAK